MQGPIYTIIPSVTNLLKEQQAVKEQTIIYKIQAGIKLCSSDRIFIVQLILYSLYNSSFGELSFLANAVSNVELISPLLDICSIDFDI